jgi:predicted nuclease of predicted toxin-antitoxin system
VKVWVDAQLSPAIARWLAETQKVEAVALSETSVFAMRKILRSSSPPDRTARS